MNVCEYPWFSCGDELRDLSLAVGGSLSPFTHVERLFLIKFSVVFENITVIAFSAVRARLCPPFHDCAKILIQDSRRDLNAHILPAVGS